MTKSMLEKEIEKEIESHLRPLIQDIPLSLQDAIVEYTIKVHHQTSKGCTEAFDDYLAIKGNENYNLGYEEGYNQRDTEYQSEVEDNNQYDWERGYRQGYEHGYNRKESLI